MHKPKHIIDSLWNFEFRQIKHIHIVLASLIIFGIGIIYVVGEVLFGFHPDMNGFTMIHYWNALKMGEFLPASNGLTAIYPHIWIILASICVIFRVTVIISSYFKSKKAIGESAFVRYLLTYFVSFLIASGTALLVVLAMAGIAYLAGFQLESGINLVAYAVVFVEEITNKYIPTLLNVQSYWVAIVLTIFLAALPGYFIHWLSHKSRFFWYAFHRCHHCPQFLHPLGAPPAFAFEFLLVLPKGLVAIAISKLIYTQPLVMEMSIWLTFGYCFEIFNHSIIHYDFAYRNLFVRNLCRLFGDKGVYHLVHHSAKVEDQTINLGSSPFMFWDRVFGTYRKPYKKAPPIGLTNTPKIKMNPLRIIFSGILQLLYELKMNKDWKTRWNILFGSIYFKPSVTREYLIINY